MMIYNADAASPAWSVLLRSLMALSVSLLSRIHWRAVAKHEGCLLDCPHKHGNMYTRISILNMLAQSKISIYFNFDIAFISMCAFIHRRKHALAILARSIMLSICFKDETRWDSRRAMVIPFVI